MNGGHDNVAEPVVAPQISVIVPAYEESEALLSHIESLVDLGDFRQVIVVDASRGDGRLVAQSAVKRFASKPCVEIMVDAPRGRARQMNAGAAAATGDILLFVHADTALPPGSGQAIEHSLGRGGEWGRFDVRLDAAGFPYRMIEFMMNHRSRITGMTTGDQCQFMSRRAFEAVGGFPEQPLMEDIEISKRLKRKFGLPAVPGPRVTTSARRWQVNGVYKTMALMWKLRLMYFFGVSPQKLASLYGNARAKAAGKDDGVQHER